MEPVLNGNLPVWGNAYGSYIINQYKVMYNKWKLFIVEIERKNKTLIETLVFIISSSHNLLHVVLLEIIWKEHSYHKCEKLSLTVNKICA